MAYLIRAQATIMWQGDGIGPMGLSGNAQALTVTVDYNPAGAATATFAANPISVPGADAPTTGNISTACTNLGTALATLFNNNISQIQGFSTGGA